MTFNIFMNLDLYLLNRAKPAICRQSRISLGSLSRKNASSETAVYWLAGNGIERKNFASRANCKCAEFQSVKTSEMRESIRQKFNQNVRLPVHRTTSYMILAGLNNLLYSKFSPYLIDNQYFWSMPLYIER
jgi:hypothetical protein